MSQMEYNEGTLVYESNDPEAFADKYVKENNIDVSEYYDSNHEWLWDVGSDHGYQVIGGRVFRVEWEHRRAGEPPALIKWEGEPGYVFHFATYHYNGGAHWTEVIEKTLRKEFGDS